MVRSVTQLAPSAFLASAAGSSPLISQLLPPHLRDASIPLHTEALKVWKGHDESPPPATASMCQKSWDNPRVDATFRKLLESVADERLHVHLLAAERKESGAWLNVLPLSAIGL